MQHPVIATLEDKVFRFASMDLIFLSDCNPEDQALRMYFAQSHFLDSSHCFDFFHTGMWPLQPCILSEHEKAILSKVHQVVKGTCHITLASLPLLRVRSLHRCLHREHSSTESQMTEQQGWSEKQCDEG